MASITLYTYFRSSAAYRVRIALNLKGLDYDSSYVHLLNNGGEQYSATYTSMNPQQRIPALDVDGSLLTQSLAIIEYLDETHPEPALLPGDAIQRSRIRAFAQAICADLHPLNNIRVLKYLESDFELSQKQRDQWYRHWIQQSFSALETLLGGDNHKSDYCFGDTPTMADLCLIPQYYNGDRFNCGVDQFSTLTRIYQHCMTRDEFYSAAPEQQGDFQQS